MRRISTPSIHTAAIRSYCSPRQEAAKSRTTADHGAEQFFGGEYSAETGGDPMVLLKLWRRRVSEHEGVRCSVGRGRVTSKYVSEPLRVRSEDLSKRSSGEPPWEAVRGHGRRTRRKRSRE